MGPDGETAWGGVGWVAVGVSGRVSEVAPPGAPQALALAVWHPAPQACACRATLFVSEVDLPANCGVVDPTDAKVLPSSIMCTARTGMHGEL